MKQVTVTIKLDVDEEELEKVLGAAYHKERSTYYAENAVRHALKAGDLHKHAPIITGWEVQS